MNCIFCYGAMGSRPSREHLFSRPVQTAFGIDSDVRLGNMDGSGIVTPMGRLADLQVRLPCEDCNRGWMSELEVQMATSVGAWHREGTVPLTAQGVETLGRWMLKTYIVLSAINGGIRRFPADLEQVEWGVIPEASRAGALWRGDSVAMDGVTIGAATTTPSGIYYGFGNPTVIPKGPDHFNVASAGVGVVNLGTLQVWCVVPFVSSAKVRLPTGVRMVDSDSKRNQLPLVASKPDLAGVVVDGPHSASAIFEEAQRWSSAPPGSLAPSSVSQPSS